MSGILTLSFEIELAWGHHDLGGSDEQLISDRRKIETDTLERLLAICDELELPISFDIVGHLLEESCDGHHEGPHPPDWFSADPGTDVEKDPKFYAPDLVNMIRDSETDHEICTHSYSHIRGDVPPDVVEWELTTATDLWERHGLSTPISYVPPRHESVTYEELRKAGIEVVRTPINGLKLEGSPVRSYLQRHRQSIPDHPPRRRRGLVETYCTPYPTLSSPALPNGQRPPPRMLQTIPRRVRQRLHRQWLKRQTRRAIDCDGHLHLWTHLYNVSNDAQSKPLFEYLRFLAKRDDEGEVDVNPMRDLVPSQASSD